MSGNDQRELPFDATESETLIMRGSSMRENRETPQFPPPDGGEGRSEKAKCRTSDTHDCGESDDLIVPTKQANKAESSAAESVEGSGSTKGNVSQSATRWTQSRKSVSIELRGVRQVTGSDTALLPEPAADRQLPEVGAV